MKKIALVMTGLGIIAGSIFGGRELCREIHVRNELKKAEVVVETIPERRYIFSFDTTHVLSPSLLTTVVVDFNDDAKKFILKATMEYLKHNPPPQEYNSEFLQKAVFWYVHNTLADSTYIYCTPLLGGYDYRDFSSSRDTLWLNEAMRGERKFTCITLSCLWAVIGNSNVVSISCLPGSTNPPPEVHILALVNDSTAIDPDNFSKMTLTKSKYLKAKKEIK
ncbi:MAG: hypothetical protein ACPL06_02200 [Candidatus Anstonellales archaeon]